MALTFEVLHKDIAGRAGKLRVGEKSARTPLLLPVVNPHLQLIRPEEMQEMGVEAIITNAYIFSKSPEFREKALSEGLHSVLNFDGIIMTDSGAFQQSVYGDVQFSNTETVLFQQAIGSDIIVPMDIATHPDSDYDTTRHELSVTDERIAEALEVIKDGHLAAPVQGGIYSDLRRSAGEFVREKGVVFCPVGAVVPLMESYRYKELVQVVMAAKEGLSPGACVHLFGAGNPHMFALAAAMGCDIFDSAAYALYAREGRYMTTYGSLHLDNLAELPCACPICRTHTAAELRTSDDRERKLAFHNLYVSLAEIARIRQSIIDGTLWELVDERCRSHPRLLDGFRTLLTYTRQLAESDRASKKRFFYRGSESCFRTEVFRHQNSLLGITLGKKVLITLDNREKKGYDNIFFFKPPFGPYLPELSETFPVGQSEIPEWDEDMMRSGCRGILSLIKCNPDTEFVIESGERWQDLIKKEFEGMEVEYAIS